MQHRIIRAVLILGITAARPATGSPQAPIQAVIVVRHAEKAPAPKEDPPLSAAGEARAQALLEALRDAGVSTIITTDQQRTRQTAAPLLTTLRLKGEIVPRTEQPEADARAIGQTVRKAGGTVLVVSHQLTIPHIIRELGGPTVATVCDVEFSNLYVLLPARSPAELKLIRSHFGAADPPHSRDCRITPVSPP